MNRALSRFAVPIGVVGIIMLLVIPVPPPLLDLLIILNVLFALVILLTTMFAQRPLDFSVFPSLLLVATLFRLGLNVASTRLVLGEGYAGQMIETFGEIAVGGSVIIGAVIFLILVVIQFVVVTKGAERVAEVGARFTLDAMPGKQMAIDADLNSGLISDDEARARRAEVSAEADFYGAMDGASKFVKGDAIVGIIVIIINIIGGLAIGMLDRGLSIGDALNTYAILTIGDGLVTQIPALLMAVSTGMIVTRASAESDMGSTASEQLLQSRTALAIAGSAAIVLAIIPGMPVIPLLVFGAVLILASRRTTSAQKAELQSADAALAPITRSDSPEELLEHMRVHAIEIQLAPDLIDLVSGGADDLLGRVRSLRRKLAGELGFVMPPVRTRDSIDLPPSTYSIRIAGVEAGRGTAPSNRVLALGDELDALPGQVMIEPVFGLSGKWVPAELRHSAELTGATIIDRVSVVVTHLSSLVSAHAARLLSREDVRILTEGVKQTNPSAVDELIPSLMSLAEVQRVLQGLLAEGVPINDLPRILEALTLRAKVSTDAEGLVESARQALAPMIAVNCMSEGRLQVIIFDPLVEQSLLESLRPSDAGMQILIEQDRLDALLQSLRDTISVAHETAELPILVCAPALRSAVRRLTSPHTQGMPVLSYQEVTSADVPFETVGVVKIAEKDPARGTVA